MTTSNQDRQSGSGFAMFSSVDFAGSRSLVITAIYQDESVVVDAPDSLDSMIDDLLIAPTNAAAQELVAELDGRFWNKHDSVVVEGSHSPIRSITVTVRGLTADGQQLGAQVLAEGTSS